MHDTIYDNIQCNISRSAPVVNSHLMHFITFNWAFVPDANSMLHVNVSSKNHGICSLQEVNPGWSTQIKMDAPGSLAHLLEHNMVTVSRSFLFASL